MTRQTHTFVILELTSPSFNEIKEKLEKASYQHCFIEDNGLIIDMKGIAIKEEKHENT